MHTPPQQTAYKQKRLTPDFFRILVVDDEPAILFAYRKLIEAEGFGIDVCDGLGDALQLINSCYYFAVITDIRLSGSENTEGIELLRAVRQRQPDSKVIVVTGFGTSSLEQNIQELGASHYFEKPVKPAAIMALLRSLHDSAVEASDDFDFELLLPEMSEAEYL
jgi:DNA-binding NtrC family response regulator